MVTAFSKGFRSPTPTPTTLRYKKPTAAAAVFRAKFTDDSEPLLQSAISATYLRSRETHQLHPLFGDPYASCLLPSDLHHRNNPPGSDHYCIATKFIDDKLLETLNRVDGVKQVVLLSDGMDTRPYRLAWPHSTILFDISPESVFRITAEKLQAVGARIPSKCSYFHVPLESSDIQQTLRLKGFTGNRPSIWVFQGLPVTTLTSFRDVLLIVSGLAMSGCLFLGELPTWLATAELGPSTKRFMEKLFMSNGFRVNEISYSEVATSLGKVISPCDYKYALFVSEQLRFSDDQMEDWRREFQRIEEEGDEEGFED